MELPRTLFQEALGATNEVYIPYPPVGFELVTSLQEYKFSTTRPMKASSIVASASEPDLTESVMDTSEWPAWLGDDSNVNDGFLLTTFPHTVFLRRCITVQNSRLDPSMERELRAHCETCGRVVRMALQSSGGCGYVEYADEESAIDVIHILDDAPLEIQGPGDSPAQRLRLKVTRTCFLVTTQRLSNPPLP